MIKSNYVWNWMVAAILLAVPAANCHGHIIERHVTLSGPSGATGSGIVVLDLDVITMNVQLTFNGLTGLTTSSQLFAIPKLNQAAIAAVPFVSFPLNANSGSYNRTFDLTQSSSYSPAFMTAADRGQGFVISDSLQAVIDGAEGQTAFIRINTTTFPNGELSGFLTAVPEPSSIQMIALLFALVCTFCVGRKLFATQRSVFRTAIEILR
ncbi:MAG: CHRD domain-containing protein [Pirellula sp.]